MKLVLSVLVALSATTALASSEQYPETSNSIGTSRPSRSVGDYTGSERTPVQPKQNLVFRAADCRNGVDRNTGEALLVCKQSSESSN